MFRRIATGRRSAEIWLDSRANDNVADFKRRAVKKEGLTRIEKLPAFLCEKILYLFDLERIFFRLLVSKTSLEKYGFFQGMRFIARYKKNKKKYARYEKQNSWFEKQLINVKKWTTNTSIMYKVYILWYEKSNKIPENLITDGNPNRRGSYDWTAESGAEGQDGSQWRESWERAESSREALESRPQHNYAVPSSKSYMYTYTKQKKINPTLLQRSIQQFRPNSLFIGNI